MVFNALDDMQKKSMVSRFQSTPAEVNTTERLSLDAGLEVKDQYRTTTDLSYCREETGPLPWGIKSILNAETRANKTNKVRKHLARLEAMQDKTKVVNDQFDARRIRTRSKIRFHYYNSLMTRSAHIKPVSKILNEKEMSRHFGTNPESMFYKPPVDTSMSLVGKF